MRLYPSCGIKPGFEHLAKAGGSPVVWIARKKLMNARVSLLMKSSGPVGYRTKMFMKAVMVKDEARKSQRRGVYMGFPGPLWI